MVASTVSRSSVELTAWRNLAERAQFLDRLRELARARLHLVEQPHILDRDHRLVGEGGDQLDLLVGEWPHARVRVKINTPMGLPSRSSGTPSMVRNLPTSRLRAK